MIRFIADVIATFELHGDNNSAQQWALNRLGNLGSIAQINTTLWIEPYSNQATLVERDGKQLNKYTVTVHMSLNASGFADAQSQIVSALTADPEVKYINIQNVKLTKMQ